MHMKTGDVTKMTPEQKPPIRESFDELAKELQVTYIAYEGGRQWKSY
jgi:hypothetical protein